MKILLIVHVIHVTNYGGLDLGKALRKTPWPYGINLTTGYA